MESISPSTSKTLIWKIVFWITGKTNKNKGLQGLIEENIENAKIFFDLQFNDEDPNYQEISNLSNNTNLVSAMSIDCFVLTFEDTDT